MLILFAIVLAFICITVATIYLFLRNDQGSKEPPLALWIAFGFGVLGVLVVIFLESKLLSKEALDPQNTTVSLGSLYMTMMGVGIIEEATKFIPLSVFLWKKSYFNEYTDGIIYFAICGLTFGMLEDISYTLLLGAKTGIVRMVLKPVFHGATTGMVGYFLARAKIRNKSYWSVLPYLLMAAFLHGLYDFLLRSGKIGFVLLAIPITIGFTIGLFYMFIKAKEKDQALGLSSIGHNKFCRNCGIINSSHTIYCEFCGVRT